jgi:hypothetical protein
MNGPLPLLLGYHMVRLGAASAAEETAAKVLTRYAAREGYALGTVYVERDYNRPCTALAAVITSAPLVGAAGIVVHTAMDLGSSEPVQHATRARLEREAGVPVLVASR